MGSTLGVLPIDTDLELPVSLTGNTQTAATALQKLNLTEDRTGWLVMLDYWLQLVTAKGAGKPEQVDSLKQTGLTAAVVAMDDIDAGGGGERHRVQVSHRGDGDTAEGHRACYRRIGMTT